jgi:uncharacterized protein involved in exopolysaccharide biosynthesis
MVTICKRKVGWLGLTVFVVLVGGAGYVGACLLDRGKPRAAALLSVALDGKPITFHTVETTPVDRERFEIYKNTQRELLVSRFVLVAALRKPEVAKLPAVRRAQEKGDPVVWLQKRLLVGFPGKAELMEVSMALDDPQEAATLVNGVVDAYLHEVVNSELDRKRKHLGELDRAVVDKEASVRAMRETLKKKYAEFGTADQATFAFLQRLVLEDAAAARQELYHVKSELRRLKADLASQKALLENPDIFSKLREEVKAEKRATIQAELKRLETAIAMATTEQQGLETEVQQKRNEAERLGAAAANVAALQNDLKSAATDLAALSAERDKFRVECRRAARVMLLIPAAVHKPGKPAAEQS